MNKVQYGGQLPSKWYGTLLSWKKVRIKRHLTWTYLKPMRSLQVDPNWVGQRVPSKITFSKVGYDIPNILILGITIFDERCFLRTFC